MVAGEGEGPGRDSRWRWWIRAGSPAFAALALTAVAGSGLVRAWPALIGSPGAEVYGHAWVQGWVARAWPVLPSEVTTVNPPDRTPWSVIDPATTWVSAGLAQLVGTTTAWNLVALSAVALAFAGGWFLARRIGGDPWTGALALALAPPLAGVLASGLSEDFAFGLLALALAGVGARTVRGAAGAGLALGLLAWTGLYLALMGAIGAAVLGLAALTQGRRAARSLAISAVIAVVVAAPAAALQGGRLAGEGHRGGNPALDRPEPHWRVNPHKGADLASLVVPGPDPVHDGALIRVHPAYLGWTLLGLALVAPPRRARAWWGVLAVVLLLVPGPSLRLLGSPTGWSNPFVAGASQLPLVGLVNHWGRLALLGAVALAALGSLGARQVAQRWPRWAWVVPIAVAIELAAVSPAPWPVPVASARIPDVVRGLGALPPGGVVLVPSAGPGVPFQRPLWLQAAHGRPVFTDPNRPGYGRAASVPLVQVFASLPGERRDPPPARVEWSLQQLGAMGVGVIVVEPPWVGEVEALLGPPDLRADDGAAWAVAAPASPG